MGDSATSGESTPGPAAISSTPRRGLRRAAIAAIGTLGVLAGLGGFTFGYGQGWSYLSNDPNACANCHIMQDHFDSWLKSSHHDVATCNDCHLLHHPIGKWITKADNGFFHSLAFTTGDFPDPLRIKPRNRSVTQAACLNCHADLVHSLQDATGDALHCARCHSDVGHSQR